DLAPRYRVADDGAGLRLEGAYLAVEVAACRVVGGDPVEFHDQPPAVGGEWGRGGRPVPGPAHPLHVQSPRPDHLARPARVDGVEDVLVDGGAGAGRGAGGDDVAPPVAAGDEAVGDLVVQGGQVGEPVGEALLVSWAEGGAGLGADGAGAHVRFLRAARARARRVARFGRGSGASSSTSCSTRTSSVSQVTPGRGVCSPRGVEDGPVMCGPPGRAGRSSG